MAWFDHKESTRLAPAQFDDVSQQKRRNPSWLCASRRHSSPPAFSVPRPPAVPTELASPRVQSSAPPPENIRPLRQDTPRESAPPPQKADDAKFSMTPVELESLVAERAMRQAAEQTLAIFKTEAAEAIQRIVDSHDRLVSEWTDRATELAMLVARRVIARELNISKDVVIELVREALEVLNTRDRVRVHLGPEFAEMQDALTSHFASSGTLIELVVDTDMPNYGCVVETDVGSVDESIDSRLSALLEVVSSEGKE